MQDVRYLFPEAGYAILLVLLFGWLLWNLFFYRQRQLNAMATKNVRAAIFVPRRSRTLYIGKAVGFCSAWVLATVALMQPISYGHYPAEITNLPAPETTLTGKRRKKAHEVILVIDASQSMMIPDARNGKTRFDTAKEIADDIVSRLGGESVGVQAFTSVVTQLSPPTLDYLFVRLMLKQLSINEGDVPGTSLIETLSKMRADYFSKPSAMRKTVIIISDGGDTAIEAAQGDERTKEMQQLLSPIRDAKQNHLRVFTIGMGARTPSTVPGVSYEGKPVLSADDEAILRQVAQTGDGAYFYANDYAPLDLAVRLIKEIEKVQTESEEEAVSITASTSGDNLIHKYYYHIPLGIAIVLLGSALLLQNTWERRKRW